jgi:hypothetical protein
MDEEITCVAEVYGVLEGEWCRSLLEANGVPVMLSAEAAGSAFRVTVGSLGRVQVFVPTGLPTRHGGSRRRDNLEGSDPHDSAPA